MDVPHLVGSVTFSLEKYENAVKENGKIFVDSSLIDKKVDRADADAYYIPATKLASDENLTGLANMIMIGYMIAKTGIMEFKNVEAAMKKVIPARKQNMLEVNMKAVELGYNYKED